MSLTESFRRKVHRVDGIVPAINLAPDDRVHENMLLIVTRELRGSTDLIPHL